MFSIKSKETRKILLYFFINPKESLYSAEIALKLGLDPANTDKCLKKLQKEGIVEVKKRGLRKYYSINNYYPLLKETERIFMFKYGLDSILKKSLKKIEGLEEAYIYGSYAKENFGAESDIDILLVGDHSPFKAAKAVSGLGKIYGREFNLTDLTGRELAGKKREKDEFILNIFKGKLIRIL